MFKDRHHLRLNSRGDEVLSLPQTTRIIMTIVKNKFFFLFYNVLIDCPDSINLIDVGDIIMTIGNKYGIQIIAVKQEMS